MKQRRLRAITLQGTIEKNQLLDGTIIILHFGAPIIFLTIMKDLFLG